MEKRENICSICGKSKDTDNSGRVSQFISTCVCSLNEDDALYDAQISICSDCGKKIDTGRVGSMTQYVLRAELCQCNVPNPRNVSPELDSSAKSNGPAFTGYTEDIEELREELDLAEGDFPFARYDPVCQLGSGSSGNVYLARDSLLKKNVAVKVLQVLTNEQLVSFQDEARTTSKLEHPSIISILDFGATESGTPFMALEYFSGITLEQQIKESGPLGWETARIIFTQICDALSYAHSQGIFHRDLKPSNILLDLSDPDNIQVRLIDFGLAKVSELTGHTTEFQGKTLVGTPYYMSPDVAKGFDYTELSEVYSVGCILFESLSGKPPFRGDTALETLALHAKEKAPLISSVCELEVPDQLESLIDKSLSKSPQERFSSAAALSLAIQEVEYRSPTEETFQELFPKIAETEASSSPGTSRIKTTWIIVFACLVFTPVLLIANKVFLNSNSTDGSKSSRDYKISKFDAPLNLSDPNTIKVLPHLEDKVFREKSYVINEHITDHELTMLDIPLDISALSISSEGITGSGLKALIHHKIKLLELNCPNLEDSPAKYVSKISTLEELDLNNPKTLTAIGYNEICSGQSVRRIHIKNTTLPPGAIAAIAKHPSITSIVFSSCQFADEKELGELAKLPELSYFRLSYSKMSSTGYRQIAKLKHLRGLSMAGVNLDYEDGKGLSHFTIPELRFSDSTITDKAFIQLAKIKGLNSIKLMKNKGTSQLCFEKFRLLKPNIILDTEAEHPTVHQIRKDFEMDKILRARKMRLGAD